MLVKYGLYVYTNNNYNKIKFILNKKIKNIDKFNRRGEFYKNDVIKIIFDYNKNLMILYIYNKK